MVASGPSGPPRRPCQRIGIPRARVALDIALLAALSAWAVVSAYSAETFHGWGAVLPPLAFAGCAAAGARYHLTTLDHRLVPSLALVAVFTAVGWGACLAEAPVAAMEDGAEAIALVTELAPDVVLMDLRMPRVDGVEATRRIRGEHPATQVVVLTTYADDDSLFPALRAGARGSPRTPTGTRSCGRSRTSSPGAPDCPRWSSRDCSNRSPLSRCLPVPGCPTG